MTSLLDAPPQRSGRAGALGLLGTAALHGALVGGSSLLSLGGVTVLKAAPVTEMVEVALPEPAAARPRASEAKPRKVAPVARERPAARVAEPAPEPPSPVAQASELLEAGADVADFGDRFVTGAGDGYPGGATDRAGASKTAAPDAHARGTDEPPREKPKPIDWSRRPRLAGGARWRIPFPSEADDAGIDHAVVTLRVEVGADGRVQRVTIISDPGSGFGRAAQRYASSKLWLPALNRDGKPISAVEVVNVRFDR